MLINRLNFEASEFLHVQGGGGGGIMQKLKFLHAQKDLGL